MGKAHAWIWRMYLSFESAQARLARFCPVAEAMRPLRCMWPRMASVSAALQCPNIAWDHRMLTSACQGQTYALWS